MNKIILKRIYNDEEVEMSFNADKDIYQVMEHWESFLLAVGYHPDTIQEGFDEKSNSSIFNNINDGDFDED